MRRDEWWRFYCEITSQAHKNILRRLIEGRSMLRPRYLSAKFSFACFVNKEFVILMTFRAALAKHIENKHTINICFNLNIIFAAFSLFPSRTRYECVASVVFAPWNGVVYVFRSAGRCENLIKLCDICESSFSGFDDVTCLLASTSRRRALKRGSKLSVTTKKP